MISFHIPEDLRKAVEAREHIHLAIYTVDDNPVKSLVGAFDQRGCYTIRWDGEDQNGEPVPGGIYRLKIDAGVYHQDYKILVMR